MDSDAWAGWVAVKIIAEAALRAHATTPAGLMRALTDPKAQFDGHKGRPLSFAADTRELLQPLYVVARDSSGVDRVISDVLPEP
jgi:ABC-type branched-subunit amino acid transport system substrate-binding protein